jgi:hypothetical protein
MGYTKQTGSTRIRRTALAAAAAALVGGGCGSANAFQIDTGNDDVQLRFDNTIRYNLGVRTHGQDTDIIKNPNYDDGDRNFDKHAVVTNRLDLLTEFDVVYQKRYGIRVSAQSWYDQAYSGGFDNNSLATSNHFENGKQAFGLSNYGQRYYEGLSGELLDAFLFGTFDLGSSALSVRAGQHTVYWGEALLLGGAISGNAYGQAPLDAGKGYSTPGIDVKELFLPLPQISATLQATPELAFMGQYYFGWESTRVMEDGTYLGPADPYFLGGEATILAPGRFVKREPDIKPDDTGDWGLAARWSPQWLDGTMGFYYRNFTDKLPQIVLQASLTGLAPPNPPVIPTRYFFTYGSDIHLYGLSLSKQLVGVSFGAELNYRTNMPLAAGTLLLLPGKPLPEPGDLIGPRGDTAHGLLNALGIINSTPLFDTASWATELTWDHWCSVTSDPTHAFKGYDTYKAIDKVSRNTYGLAVNFTPTWFQVFPSADLSLPLAYSRGLTGNSTVLFGANKGAGNYSAGLGLDLYSRYNFVLKYVAFFGNSTTTNGVVTTPEGLTALLKDRGAVYLTFKTTL